MGFVRFSSRLLLAKIAGQKNPVAATDLSLLDGILPVKVQSEERQGGRERQAGGLPAGQAPS
jgi:hypothetical protein